MLESTVQVVVFVDHVSTRLEFCKFSNGADVDSCCIGKFTSDHNDTASQQSSHRSTDPCM